MYSTKLKDRHCIKWFEFSFSLFQTIHPSLLGEGGGASIGGTTCFCTWKGGVVKKVCTQVGSQPSPSPFPHPHPSHSPPQLPVSLIISLTLVRDLNLHISTCVRYNSYGENGHVYRINLKIALESYTRPNPPRPPPPPARTGGRFETGKKKTQTILCNVGLLVSYYTNM